MRTLFLGILLSFSLFTSAQKNPGKPAKTVAKPVVYKGPEIEFRNKIHDFGRININIQYARTTFIFKNTGDRPLVISSAVASCGCTTPDWTRDSVMPGDSGHIDVRYETIGRPGSFRKTITVYCNSVTQPFVHLDILGDVFQESHTNVTETPNYGSIYFSQQTLDFKNLTDKGPDTIQTRLINGSLFSTEFEPLGKLPEYCTILGYPRSLEPNENALLTVIIDGRKVKSYGFAAFEIPVNSSSPVNPNLGLFVTYTRKQYFPKMNAKQLAKSAHLKISAASEILNFGVHQSGDVVDTSLIFTNTGKEDLVMHEIYPECTCVRINFPKKVLKPGESMKVDFSFDTVTKNGVSRQSIWIVCNDPVQPERYLYMQVTLPKVVQKCLTCPNR